LYADAALSFVTLVPFPSATSKPVFTTTCKSGKK
jgi:hypothetical protein